MIKKLHMREDFRGEEYLTIEGNVLKECSRDAVGEISIPDYVTTIGYAAFFCCENLKSIIIPNSVTYIAPRAFSGCESLESITIPNSVETIETWTFEHCKSLKSITIPNSVTKIDTEAFEYCESLKTITLSQKLFEINKGAFSNCKSLKFITIPNSVHSIGSKAFMDCKSLVSITIPNSVESINWGTFQNCRSLKSITIPTSVKEISRFAFDNCTSLKSVNILNPANNIEIYEDAFSNCPNINAEDMTIIQNLIDKTTRKNSSASNNKHTESSDDYTVEISTYTISYEDPNSWNDGPYSYGDYLQILQNPKSKKYIWVTSLDGFECERTFRTANAAFNNASKVLKPDDGSKLYLDLQ